jgi:predicted CxxxxCH...CXXCH cytochrome family protein
MNGLGCHGLLVNSPHPAKPWTSNVAGAPTHTTTDTGNVGTCAICHTGGANSDVKPPAPAAGPAGCYNNTLCHFHSIPYTAPTAHGAEAKKNLLVCKTCHGTGANAFDGGTTTTACSTCHTAAKAHPTDWQGSGTYSHRTALNTANACSICHNVTTSGAGPLAGAPSCLSATFTNALGQARTCHAGGPGNAPHPVPYAAHNATARTNFPYCQGCHQVAQNATVPPGCQNCHLTSPVATPTGCTSCHANPPNSTTYPNVAATHAAHVTAGKVSTVALTCADCHTGLGLGTVDHQVRAKARTATGRANPVVFSSLSLIGTTAAFNDVNGQCTNAYCHGAQMPGDDTTGSNRSPIWSNSFLPANISVAACGTCHGFPPTTASGHPAVSAPTTFPLGSGCSCHANISGTGTTYTNIFVNKALHINGIFEPTAAGGHNPLFPNYNHQAAGTGSACTGCHAIGTATSVYPAAVLGNAPDCRGCHKKAAPGIGCGSCHGGTNGKPTGAAFPDRIGYHGGDQDGDHNDTNCALCHNGGGAGSGVNHGPGNRGANPNLVGPMVNGITPINGVKGLPNSPVTCNHGTIDSGCGNRTETGW